MIASNSVPGTTSSILPPILLINSSGQITHITDAILPLLELSSHNQIIGKRGREFWAEIDKVESTLQNVLQTGYWHGTFLTRKIDGSTKPIHVKAWKLNAFHSDYQILVLLSSSAVGLELFSMFGEKGTITLPHLILRGIQHDLNNALLHPLFMLPLLQPCIPAENKEAMDDLRASESACQHAASIIEHMGQWMKTWANPERIRKPVNISKLVENAARFAVIGSKIKLQLHLAPSLPEVECDETGLLRVLTNLLLNARQASEQDGNLTIQVDTTQSATLPPCTFLRISITDYGKGIDPEQLGQLFTMGYTTKEEGRGVGLAISNHIIQEHGGHIDVSSKPGQGTTFTIRLPLQPEKPSPPPKTLSSTAANS